MNESAAATGSDRAERAEAALALERQRREAAERLWMPVQTKGGGTMRVPRDIIERAYGVYSSRYGRTQTLDRLCERGGFHEEVLDEFVPGWRDEMSAVVRAQDLAERDALRAEVRRVDTIADSSSAALLASLRERGVRVKDGHQAEPITLMCERAALLQAELERLRARVAELEARP